MESTQAVGGAGVLTGRPPGTGPGGAGATPCSDACSASIVRSEAATAKAAASVSEFRADQPQPEVIRAITLEDRPYLQLNLHGK